MVGRGSTDPVRTISAGRGVWSRRTAARKDRDAARTWEGCGGGREIIGTPRLRGWVVPRARYPGDGGGSFGRLSSSKLPPRRRSLYLCGFSGGGCGRPGRGSSYADSPDPVFVLRAIHRLILSQQAKIMGGSISFSHCFSGVARHNFTSGGRPRTSPPSFWDTPS